MASLAPRLSFSFPSLNPSPSSFSIPTGKSRILPLRNLHFHGRPHSYPIKSKTNQGFQVIHLSPIPVNPRRSYVPSLSAHQASPANREDRNSKQPTDVETLIKAYKQALFNEDEFTVTKLETAFCVIEKEKKRFDHKVLSLSMKIASEKDTRIRLQADFDNTRKKLDKDRLNTESSAKVQIMKSLLPLIDSFERARQLIKSDTENEKKIDTSYQGIYRQLVEVLRHLRVKAIATVGKPFDPLLHEAISREESEAVRAGMITEEFTRGFLLGDRVLRLSKVKVSLGQINNKAASATDQTTPSA